MELRRRKLGDATPAVAKLDKAKCRSAPIRRRGLSSSAASGGEVPQPGAGATAPPQAEEPAARPAATPAAGSAVNAAASQDVPVVPTPEATNGEGGTAKRKRGRLPPVDIGTLQCSLVLLLSTIRHELIPAQAGFRLL